MDQETQKNRQGFLEGLYMDQQTPTKRLGALASLLMDQQTQANIDISLNIKQAYIWIRKAKKISEISQQVQRWIRSFLKIS